MFPEYDEHIKSEVADIKNVGDGRWAGAITAAKFLEQFVDEKPWVHLDIAGPAFVEKPKPWTDGGGKRRICAHAGGSRAAVEMIHRFGVRSSECGVSFVSPWSFGIRHSLKCLGSPKNRRRSRPSGCRS